MKQIFKISLAAFSLLLFVSCNEVEKRNDPVSLLLSVVSDPSILDQKDNSHDSSRIIFQIPVYVDSVAGNDSNPGTPSSPFKSITKALSKSYKFIYVAPGIYSEYETFPLIIPDNAKLIGDEAGKGVVGGTGSAYGGTGSTPRLGETVIINFSGTDSAPLTSRTLVLGNNSTIAGFRIENNDSKLINTRCAVCLENKMGTIIRNNSISTYQPDRNGSGIYISGNGGNHSIISNHFTRSTYSINEVSQTYRSKVEYNLFQNVRFAAVVRVGNLDLGGGGSSAGENTFRCYNFTSQILTEGLSGVTVFARNNIWGHIPIQQTTNMNDWYKDIVNLNDSLILSEQAVKDTVNCL
ncbi:DUF1565 domain-containing protein [Leptospira noguchii]|uniref:DUF1565 domain-containing protein n=1 Tax=Leptospira noguchii TaxID=28182 RepID=UPI001F0665D1|nr:DUF1565 domain-containing protein [Leptospira noguchii]MCH1912335.1 DUF1565 domain-containing protein [Leptospira noguchii]MCH1916020.1 DUF1565 domain-containing protein [Leptospira noguchii]UOG63429.1 DUF1565 domain-containing protein [Leptospira noguchii]